VKPLVEGDGAEADRRVRPVAEAQGRNLAASDLRSQGPLGDSENVRRLSDGQKLWGFLQHVGSCAKSTLLVGVRAYAQAVAVIAPEALTAMGWQPVDATARYWRHELRYGPAIFDRWEVDSMEQRGQRPRPRRASPCLCRTPYGRLEELICWTCGRRMGG
jgi:hypothetical protein